MFYRNRFFQDAAKPSGTRFSEIDVKKIISLHKLHDEDLKQYDFIISTVPLDLDESKYLCVSPLLNDGEKEKVRKQIDILNKR